MSYFSDWITTNWLPVRLPACLSIYLSIYLSTVTGHTVKKKKRKKIPVCVCVVVVVGGGDDDCGGCQLLLFSVVTIFHFWFYPLLTQTHTQYYFDKTKDYKSIHYCFNFTVIEWLKESVRECVCIFDNLRGYKFFFSFCFYLSLSLFLSIQCIYFCVRTIIICGIYEWHT